MSIIADVGSPSYYEGRAMELIREGNYQMATSILALLQASVGGVCASPCTKVKKV